MFENIVTVRVRTGKEEEFMYDGRPFIIDVKKGIKVPRHMAEMAIKQNALRWNPATGLVEEALVYIEDDQNTTLALPSKPISAEEIEVVKNTDGLGNDSILVNGKVVKKTTIDFKNTYQKEDFTKNNVG